MKGLKGTKQAGGAHIEDAAAGLRICLLRSTEKAWAAYVFAVSLPVQGTTPAQGRLVFQLPIRQLLGVRRVKGPYAPTNAPPTGLLVLAADGRQDGERRDCGSASWHRGRCVVIAGEVDAGVLTEFVEAVVGLDHADGAR